MRGLPVWNVNSPGIGHYNKLVPGRNETHNIRTGIVNRQNKHKQVMQVTFVIHTATCFIKIKKRSAAETNKRWHAGYFIMVDTTSKHSSERTGTNCQSRVFYAGFILAHIHALFVTKCVTHPAVASSIMWDTLFIP